MSKYKYVFGHITETNLVYEVLAIKAYIETILKFKTYNCVTSDNNKFDKQLYELNKCIRSERDAKIAAANTHFVNAVDKITDYLSEFIDFQMDSHNNVNKEIKYRLLDYIKNQLVCVSIDRDLSYINLMGAIRKLKEFICSEV